MKENNLLQKKLAVHQEVLMPMKIMLPILEKKDLGLPPCKKICNSAWMRVLIQQNMQVCQRVMPM
jgi:hypothetical protein